MPIFHNDEVMTAPEFVALEVRDNRRDGYTSRATAETERIIREMDERDRSDPTLLAAIEAALKTFDAEPVGRGLGSGVVLRRVARHCVEMRVRNAHVTTTRDLSQAD